MAERVSHGLGKHHPSKLVNTFPISLRSSGGKIMVIIKVYLEIHGDQKPPISLGFMMVKVVVI